MTNVRSYAPQALSAVPDKFREELRKAESKQKDTKYMFHFVNIYNEYFKKSLPQNPDLYDSKIPMIEFDDFVVRIYNLYTKYHGTPIPAFTEKRDLEAFHKDHCIIIAMYNTKIEDIQHEEYQRTVAIVQEIIMRGRFGDQGYNTKKHMKTSINYSTYRPFVDFV